MSLDARLSTLWIRLQNRFKASQTAFRELPRIVESIQPITNADELLQSIYIKRVSVVHGAGIVGIQMLCPDGSWLLPSAPSKRYRIVGFELFTSAGVGTFDLVLLEDNVTTFRHPLIPVIAVPTTYTLEFFANPIPVNPGWSWFLDIVANVAGSTFQLTVHLVEEDAY